MQFDAILETALLQPLASVSAYSTSFLEALNKLVEDGVYSVNDKWEPQQILIYNTIAEYVDINVEAGVAIGAQSLLLDKLGRDMSESISLIENLIDSIRSVVTVLVSSVNSNRLFTTEMMNAEIESLQTLTGELQVSTNLMIQELSSLSASSGEIPGQLKTVFEQLVKLAAGINGLEAVLSSTSNNLELVDKNAKAMNGADDSKISAITLGLKVLNVLKR